MTGTAPVLLLTAFGPFPGVPSNPSAEVMARLADRWRKGAPAGLIFETHILPTEYRAVAQWVESRLRAGIPDILIMLGYSAVADRLKIETRASNRCAPHLPDAAGHHPLADDGPVLHLPATLPLDTIGCALDHVGIDHIRSDDAGEYLCNHIFYKVQQRIAQADAPCRSGFLHLPPVDFGSGRIVPQILDRARPVDEILRAIEIIAECAAAMEEGGD